METYWRFQLQTRRGASYKMEIHWPQGPGTQALLLKLMHLTVALHKAAILQLFSALPINQYVKKVWWYLFLYIY